MEARERTVRNFYGLADKEWYFVLLLLCVHLVDAAQDTCYLLRTQGRGIHLAAVLLGVAQEAQHIGSITNYNRNLAYESGLHQHVTRIRDLLFRDFLTVADGIDFFGRNQHLGDVVLEVVVANFGFDILFDLRLLATDGTDNIPLFLNLAHRFSRN